MQLLEKTSKTQTPVSDETINAYIDKVMHELLYPIFLRKRVYKDIYEFLFSETGLDATLAEMPADQFGFRIGETREDVAQDFAATLNMRGFAEPCLCGKRELLSWY